MRVILICPSTQVTQKTIPRCNKKRAVEEKGLVGKTGENGEISSPIEITVGSSSTGQSRDSPSSALSLKNRTVEKNSARMERWKSHLEITSTQRPLVEEPAVSERLNLRNPRPPVSTQSLIQGKTSVSPGSRSSIDLQKIRRVVFSALTYPSLPLKEFGKIVLEDGK